jgi:predicted transposase YbfD/YdcC
MEISESETLSTMNNTPHILHRIPIFTTAIIYQKTTTEIQFYLTSLRPTAERLMALIRTHWSIENQLHWCLNVVFQEDQSRIRKGHSPRNFGLLRRLALSLLERETSFKASLKRKRYKALLNHDYLCTILANAFA